MGTITEPDWAEFAWCWEPTGSRVICDPPPLTTDEDFVVWSPRHLDTELDLLGFKKDVPGEGSTPGHSFTSWRRGDVNLITTRCQVFYKRFCAATKEAAKLNLRDKRDRVFLFQQRLYGSKALSKDEVDQMYEDPTKMKAIIDAITNGNVIEFVYKDEKRTVEPHTFGLGKSGKTLLSGYQTSGGRPGWRLFDVRTLRSKDISTIDGVDFTARDGYNPADSRFESIEVGI